MEPMETCVICLENNEEDSILSGDLFIGACNCSYNVHKKCITTWLLTKNTRDVKCINCASDVSINEDFQRTLNAKRNYRLYSLTEYMLAGAVYVCLAILLYFLAYVWCISIKVKS